MTASAREHRGGVTVIDYLSRRRLLSWQDPGGWMVSARIGFILYYWRYAG